MSHEFDTSNIESLSSEVIKGIEYFNFSGHPLGEILHHFQKEETKDAFSKVVILPDFSPVRGPLPTGCCVEVKSGFNWRELVLSDIGCGMALVKSKTDWNYFNDHLDLWDNMADRLRDNKGKKGDLGSGNHFLDAVIDDEENVYFAVHTGSRNQAAKIGNLVNFPEFEKEYERISRWAEENRREVLRELKKVYGPLEFILDKRHNFYLKDEGKKKVLIYKGATRVAPGDLGLIPSSMDGEMLLVRGQVGSGDINYAMCHGTGRLKSRSVGREEAVNFDASGLRRRIYIPTSIEDRSIIPERPESYRRMDEIKPFVLRFTQIEKVLTPVAYIGQI